mgnify:CR=1 FL=1
MEDVLERNRVLRCGLHTVDISSNFERSAEMKNRSSDSDTIDEQTVSAGDFRNASKDVTVVVVAAGYALR